MAETSHDRIAACHERIVKMVHLADVLYQWLIVEHRVDAEWPLFQEQVIEWSQVCCEVRQNWIDLNLFGGMPSNTRGVRVSLKPQFLFNTDSEHFVKFFAPYEDGPLPGNLHEWFCGCSVIHPSWHEAIARTFINEEDDPPRMRVWCGMPESDWTENYFRLEELNWQNPDLFAEHVWSNGVAPVGLCHNRASVWNRWSLLVRCELSSNQITNLERIALGYHWQGWTHLRGIDPKELNGRLRSEYLEARRLIPSTQANQGELPSKSVKSIGADAKSCADQSSDVVIPSGIVYAHPTIDPDNLPTDLKQAMEAAWHVTAKADVVKCWLGWRAKQRSPQPMNAEAGAYSIQELDSTYTIAVSKVQTVLSELLRCGPVRICGGQFLCAHTVALNYAKEIRDFVTFVGRIAIPKYISLPIGEHIPANEIRDHWPAFCERLDLVADRVGEHLNGTDIRSALQIEVIKATHARTSLSGLGVEKLTRDNHDKSTYENHDKTQVQVMDTPVKSIDLKVGETQKKGSPMGLTLLLTHAENVTNVTETRHLGSEIEQSKVTLRLPSEVAPEVLLQAASNLLMKQQNGTDQITIWSPELLIQEWKDVLGVSRNTASDRLKEWSKVGEAEHCKGHRGCKVKLAVLTSEQQLKAREIHKEKMDRLIDLKRK